MVAAIGGGALALPLLAWSDAQLEQLGAALGLACQDWRRDWGLASGGAEAGAMTAERMAALAPLDWQALHAVGADAPRAWLALAAPGPAPAPGGTGGQQALRDEMFGAPAQCLVDHGVAQIAAELADAAWRDGLERMARAARVAPGMTGGRPTPGDCGAWSGAVLLRWALAGHDLLLLLNGLCVRQLVAPVRAVAPAPSPTPLRQALRHERTELRAELKGAELSLGGLRALAPGDVIVLPHALDEALSLVGADGRPVCRGYLGQQHGHRVLELLAPQRPRPVVKPTVPPT